MLRAQRDTASLCALFFLVLVTRCRMRSRQSGPRHAGIGSSANQQVIGVLQPIRKIRLGNPAVVNRRTALGGEIGHYLVAALFAQSLWFLYFASSSPTSREALQNEAVGCASKERRQPWSTAPICSVLSLYSASWLPLQKYCTMFWGAAHA